MASSRIAKLEASKRKRLGYISKYHLQTSDDVVLLRLEKAIKQERIKSMRRSKKQNSFALS